MRRIARSPSGPNPRSCAARGSSDGGAPRATSTPIPLFAPVTKRFFGFVAFTKLRCLPLEIKADSARQEGRRFSVLELAATTSRLPRYRHY